MKRLLGFFSVVTLCVASAALPALAQSDAVRALYASSATVSTNVPGIKTYPAPPAGFNAITASDEALATYGLPPRPNQQNDPHAYAGWVRAMAHARHPFTGQLKPHPEAVLGPAKLSQKQPAVTAGSATPSNYGSLNWSGVANSNKLTKWNANTSFNNVFSEFNVPVVDQTFDTCNPIEWEVTWNGIDGALNGTVLQGGSSSQTFCTNGSVTANYYAWVEWYPSYPIVEVFAVNPGDDMYVNTFSTGGSCSPGSVYVEDETTLEFGTFQLDWLNGPCLAGSSAEIIVERPFGDGSTASGFYPLANYIWDFALSWDYNAKGTEFGPGLTSPTTLIFTMVDDSGDQNISIPTVEGKYSMFFWDTNCAYTGGCK